MVKKATKKVISDKEFVESTPEERAKGITKVPAEIIRVPKGKELVNKDNLAKMLERMDKLEADNVSLRAQQEATADKARLQNYQDKITEKGKRKVGLNVWEDKIVIGWDKMTMNRCEKNPQGFWEEDLKCNLYLIDGTEVKDLDFSIRNKRMERIDATILKKYEGDETFILNGVETHRGMFDVITDDGTKVTIDDRFVN